MHNTFLVLGNQAHEVSFGDSGILKTKEYPKVTVSGTVYSFGSGGSYYVTIKAKQDIPAGYVGFTYNGETYSTFVPALKAGKTHQVTLGKRNDANVTFVGQANNVVPFKTIANR